MRQHPSVPLSLISCTPPPLSSFPPDPVPEFWSPDFACPATAKSDVPEVFTCQSKIYRAVLNQTLDQPPGQKFVYSGEPGVEGGQGDRVSLAVSKPSDQTLTPPTPSRSVDDHNDVCCRQAGAGQRLCHEGRSTTGADVMVFLALRL